MHNLISPYGGSLVNLIANPERQIQLKQEARDLLSIDLNSHQIADLELLMNGGFSPLTGFMGRADFDSVVQHMTLADGRFWPVPISLAVHERMGAGLVTGQRIALRDREGFMLAVLTLSEIWSQGDMMRLAGGVEGGALIPHHDFLGLRMAPEDLRRQLARRGWRRILAYQPDAPIFRAEHDWLLEAARKHEASVLLQPVAGEIPADETEYFARIHSYLGLLKQTAATSMVLGLLPLANHGGGLRCALLKAIVARNFGCTHVLLAGASQAELDPYAAKLDLKLISQPQLAFIEGDGKYLQVDAVPADKKALPIELNGAIQRLEHGQGLPDWFAHPEVAEALARAYPARYRQGFCVFCTGLSGAGKSTIAKALMARLLERGGRQVTLLDGDIVRKNLSSELGFSREHRDLNVRRIGYVASEIVKHRGVAICAPIAPYAATRQAVRHLIEQFGGFFEIHVSTPIETCESRDRKGLYAKARAGLVKEFTGVSDPYEAPVHPELAIDTTHTSVDAAVQRILLKLEHDGFLR